jgi:hypothetical protein
MSYTSKLPYQTERMQAAAIYCSDGRVTEQYDDFLTNGLKLPCYDRVALPGGPACLAGYSEARITEAGLLDELKFLIKAHGVKRVVLIQHEDCAFYKVRLEAQQESIESLQKADLLHAAYLIRRTVGVQHIDGYFARRNEDGVHFEQVDIL